MIGPKIEYPDIKELKWRQAEEVREARRKNKLLRERNAKSVMERRLEDQETIERLLKAIQELKRKEEEENKKSSESHEDLKLKKSQSSSKFEKRGKIIDKLADVIEDLKHKEGYDYKLPKDIQDMIRVRKSISSTNFVQDNKRDYNKTPEIRNFSHREEEILGIRNQSDGDYAKNSRNFDKKNEIINKFEKEKYKEGVESQWTEENKKGSKEQAYYDEKTHKYDQDSQDIKYREGNTININEKSPEKHYKDINNIKYREGNTININEKSPEKHYKDINNIKYREGNAININEKSPEKHYKDINNMKYEEEFNLADKDEYYTDRNYKADNKNVKNRDEFNSIEFHKKETKNSNIEFRDQQQENADSYSKERENYYRDAKIIKNEDGQESNLRGKKKKRKNLVQNDFGINGKISEDHEIEINDMKYRENEELKASNTDKREIKPSKSDESLSYKNKWNAREASNIFNENQESIHENENKNKRKLKNAKNEHFIDNFEDKINDNLHSQELKLKKYKNKQDFNEKDIYKSDTSIENKELYNKQDPKYREENHDIKASMKNLNGMKFIRSNSTMNFGNKEKKSDNNSSLTDRKFSNEKTELSLSPVTKGRERYINNLLNKFSKSVKRTQGLADYLIKSKLIEKGEFPPEFLENAFKKISDSPERPTQSDQALSIPFSESKSTEDLLKPSIKRKQGKDFSLKTFDYQNVVAGGENLWRQRMRAYYYHRVKPDFSPIPSEKKKIELDLIKERLGESKRRRTAVAKLSLGLSLHKIG